MANVTDKEPDGKLTIRNKLAFSTSIVALLFLVPGVYLPMLTITGKQLINVGAATKPSAELDIFDSTRSILGTVSNLWDRDYFFVAIMIFLFSVIIPVFKGAILFYTYFCKRSAVRKKIFSFIKSIGKWSMCDVFIVAIFLAYLSTGASQGENVEAISVMGFSLVDVIPSVTAELQIGFWYFLSYCLLSLAALQLYDPY